MKIKLFSPAHVKEVKVLFPEKDLSWYNLQWTDDEINACKAIELKAFVDNPQLKTYPKPELLDFNRKPTEILLIAKKYLDKKTFLSVGCGFGQTEMRLAFEHPDVMFTAIDNAPYVECLNNVAEDLGLKNITFCRLDLRTTKLEKFDIVFSQSVIYCIPDDYLHNYFETLSSHTNLNGTMLIGCSSNIHFLMKLKLLFKPSKSKQLVKQTGWMRDIAHVRRLMPNNICIKKIHHFKHFYHPALPNFIYIFSKRFFPISNSSYTFIVKKLVKS